MEYINLNSKKIELPFVSVIIPTYNDWAKLKICLYALTQQTYPIDRFEIIVVNNNPQNKLPLSIILPDNCIIIEELLPGSYAARNKALLIANGELYAFTDSDCKPKDDWIEVAVSFLSSQSLYSRVAGKVSLYSKNIKFNWFEIYESIFAFPQDDFVTQSGVAATANMITMKKVFDLVGPFDSDLMSGGDIEWGMRANLKKKLNI